MKKLARIWIWLVVVTLAAGCAAQRRPCGSCYVRAPRPLSVPRVHR